VIGKSVEIKLHAIYQKAKYILKCARIKLRKSAFKKYREKYFNIIDIKKVKQLNLAVFNLKPESQKLKTIMHDSEKRRLIAAMLYDQTPGLTEKTRLNRRILTIKIMIEFYRIHQASRQKKLMFSGD
jgi:hypothetical protein